MVDCTHRKPGSVAFLFSHPPPPPPFLHEKRLDTPLRTEFKDVVRRPARLEGDQDLIAREQQGGRGKRIFIHSQ